MRATRNVTISKETNFFDEKTCLGLRSTKQVEKSHITVPQSKKSFLDLFFDRELFLLKILLNAKKNFG